ncbi:MULTISPECIES: hypothetical protein [Burkholderia cepacia complex]|uniref:hypothetical protein n=1 Tax=Burkholderia cepacia complex TaxID=87882 RepID=UPI001907F1D4|nr:MULTISPECIES: hypothetical protein [Burkholderia cepacia complex]MBJ9727555.1 hypothetical protein [Burkholderia cenocepacia]MDN7533642.1 hypothetical protein [Burkholderia orbicola]
MAMVLAAIAARDSMNEKRVTENSVTLFRIWCRLQDSNPPPDDYKALENVNDCKGLAHFRVSKTDGSVCVPALSDKGPPLIGNAIEVVFQRAFPAVLTGRAGNPVVLDSSPAFL